MKSLSLWILYFCFLASQISFAGTQPQYRYYGIQTNWDVNYPRCFTVQKLPPSVGTIVDARLDASVDKRWVMGLENLSTQSGTFFIVSEANHFVRLLNPANNQPLANSVTEYQDITGSISSSFDGAIDYDGASGETFLTHTGVDYSCAIYNSANNPEFIAALTGEGRVCLPIDVGGHLTVVGGANLAHQSHMEQAFRITLTIQYIPAGGDGGGQIP